LESLRELLQAGANANSRLRPPDTSGYTVLMYASILGHSECVRELILFKADVNAKSAGGMNALAATADFGHVESLRELLKGNPNISARDEYGVTALMYASMPNVNPAATHDGITASVAAPRCLVGERNIKCECVRELLRAGADVNASDHLGLTALMWASKNSSCKDTHEDENCCMVQELLKAGSDRSAKSVYGRNANQEALLVGRYACVELFNQHAIDEILDQAQSISVLTLGIFEKELSKDLITISSSAASEVFAFLDKSGDGAISSDEIMRYKAHKKKTYESLLTKRQAADDEDRAYKEADRVFFRTRGTNGMSTEQFHEWLDARGIDKENWFSAMTKRMEYETERMLQVAASGGIPQQNEFSNLIWRSGKMSNSDSSS